MRLDRHWYIAAASKGSYDRRMGMVGLLYGRRTRSVDIDCRTAGIDPPKTHWAQKIETPPFIGYPLRPGITFTYLGVKVNGDSRVLLKNGRPTANLFAAGEVMAGNILGEGYLAGFGMAIGTVFGRIAGREAAKIAGNSSRN